jgi:hypothetical protein
MLFVCEVTGCDILEFYRPGSWRECLWFLELVDYLLATYCCISWPNSSCFLELFRSGDGFFFFLSCESEPGIFAGVVEPRLCGDFNFGTFYEHYLKSTVVVLPYLIACADSSCKESSRHCCML